MKTFDRRLNKLEQHFGVSITDRFVLVMSLSSQKLALDQDRCIQILVESGFVRRSGLTLIHLDNIPKGLSAGGTERFLREEGPRLTGFRTIDSRRVRS